jgi:predicted GH43/DUF377 family glycosyl hydrolase
MLLVQAKGERDFVNQQWNISGGVLTSFSATNVAGVTMCATLQVTTPQDCGTSLWFANDATRPSTEPDGSQSAAVVTTVVAFAVATFGELRGGNLSLVSSTDLVEWKDEGVILSTRQGYWDNATLSTGPSPVRLSDGNWLLLYNVDNLWPVHDPEPMPSWGRCALGWAILDQRNLTRVLARAPEPLVRAELEWEVKGATAMVVYSEGIKPEGNDT